MTVLEDDTPARSAFRASRQAKQEALEALHVKTQILLERFDQYTQTRWDVVKKVADAGYLQHSRAMAASVQVLQDRVDANNKALAKHKTPLNDEPSTAQHTSSITLQLQEVQQQQPASGTSAQPEPHAHHPQHIQAGGSSSSLASSSSSSRSNPQDACSKRPAPPPPPPPLPAQLPLLQPVRTKPAGQALPGKAVLARRAGAQQGQVPRTAPPPPPGPPPPHKWCAGAPAGPGRQDHGGQQAATVAAAAQGGPVGCLRPAPPPPPGPPPPHPFCTNSKAGGQQQQQQDMGGPKPAPPAPPLPPGGFGAACKPPHTSSNRQGHNPASPAAASQTGNDGPARSPPPPPPLPPGGFRTPPRPKTAPGGCSSGGPGSHPGINALAAAAAAAGARRAQQDGQEPCTPKGPLLSHNSFSSMVSPRSAEAGASTCGKLKRLHVDPVPKHRMMDGSFWNTTGDLVKPFQAEFEYALRCMFSSTTANGRRATDGGGGGVDGAAADEAAGRVIKVIADKRALQVEVCIKRLRMDAPALAAALNRIDTDRLKQDDLPQIRSMLPKPDELSAVHAAKKKALKEHTAKLAAMAAVGGSNARMRGSSSSDSDSHGEGVPPPPPRLGVVEAAFEALGGVQMLMAKMRACEFKYDIETVSAQVDDFVVDLSAALCVFRSCGQLQYLLAFVRDVANTMNASAVQGGTAVEGLKLDSLSRLQSTRMAGATDLNLLHYIVAHLSSLMPGVLELDATREVFKAVTKRGTFDTVLTRVRGLREMHKRISNDLAKAREHLRRTSPKAAGHGRCGKDGSSSGGSVASPPAAAPGASSSSGGPPSTPPQPAAAATPAAASEAPDGGVGSPATPAAAAAAAAGGSDADAAAEQHVYIDRLAQLLDSSGGKIDSMDAKMQGVIQQFRWTAEFFCEDVNVGWKQQPAAFITHFADLLEALEATKKDTARVAKVNKILGQFFEEQQRRQEEEEAAAAAAAAEAGVELGWPEDDGDEQQQQQQQQQQQRQLYPSLHQRLLLDHAGSDVYSNSGFGGEQQQSGGSANQGPDEEEEVMRLTRTNSWVMGVANLARSLQFCAPSGSEEEEGSEAGSCVGEGHAGVGVHRDAHGVPNQHCAAGEAPLLQQQQQQQEQEQHPMTGDSSSDAREFMQQQPGATTATAAAAPAAGLQQQRQELSLPVTHWQPDMLAGVWGSCLSVASGGASAPGSGSGLSSSRSSADAPGIQQHRQ